MGRFKLTGFFLFTLMFLVSSADAGHYNIQHKNHTGKNMEKNDILVAENIINTGDEYLCDPKMIIEGPDVDPKMLLKGPDIDPKILIPPPNPGKKSDGG